MDQFHYRYFAQQSAHMRVLLMVPLFNYNTVPPRVPEQLTVTVMNGISYTRLIPSWTATARLMVEIDINPCEFTAIEEMVEKADVVGRHLIIDLMHALLQPYDEASQCLEQSCLSILNATMHEHPAIFRQFVGAFKFRTTVFDLAHVCRVPEGVSRPRRATYLRDCG
eukprot:418042-Amphidinium_carterae.2